MLRILAVNDAGRWGLMDDEILLELLGGDASFP
jgi:hypothetical protein